MSKRSYVLALDTATRHPALGLVGSDDALVTERQWESRHRHGEQLLEELDALLAGVGGSGGDLRGVIVGIGPGSFTGLRIGLATAKTIAYALDVPLVGVSTTQSLALAANAANEEGRRTTFAVSLPAGATDRYVHRVAVDARDAVREETAPQLVIPGTAYDEATAEALVVAVDLDDAEDVADQDKARGALALRGLAAALAKLGTAALGEGRAEDVARVVPAYVALPRGIARAAAEMTWSPDLR
jgi:tRNA threonylcarbamoyl adenosine modification protein YeaZ